MTNTEVENNLKTSEERRFNEKLKQHKDKLSDEKKKYQKVVKEYEMCKQGK